MRRSLSEVILAAAIICLISSSAPAMTHDTFRCPNGPIIQINDKLIFPQNTGHTEKLGYNKKPGGVYGYRGKKEVRQGVQG